MIPSDSTDTLDGWMDEWMEGGGKAQRTRSVQADPYLPVPDRSRLPIAKMQAAKKKREIKGNLRTSLAAKPHLFLSLYVCMCVYRSLTPRPCSNFPNEASRQAKQSWMGE